MSTAVQHSKPPEQPHAGLLALTASACEVARRSVNIAIGVLTSGQGRCMNPYMPANGNWTN